MHQSLLFGWNMCQEGFGILVAVQRIAYVGVFAAFSWLAYGRSHSVWVVVCIIRSFPSALLLVSSERRCA